MHRLSERLATAQLQKDHPTASTSYNAVLQDCDRIKNEHDAQCDRAVRAVALLRDKNEWRTCVAVEVEEPEDFVPIRLLLPQHPQFTFSRLLPIPNTVREAVL